MGGVRGYGPHLRPDSAATAANVTALTRPFLDADWPVSMPARPGPVLIVVADRRFVPRWTHAVTSEAFRALPPHRLQGNRYAAGREVSQEPDSLGAALDGGGSGVPSS